MIIITEQEKAFLSYVKEHREIGYGRMMQIISHEWYCYLQRTQPGYEGGAKMANTCYAFLPEEVLAPHLWIMEQERIAGMEYTG